MSKYNHDVVGTIMAYLALCLIGGLGISSVLLTISSIVWAFSVHFVLGAFMLFMAFLGWLFTIIVAVAVMN